MKQLKKSIVLMGIKHCGKSTLGKALAKYYACPFFDTDDVITEIAQKTPRQIYSEEGQSGFLKAEANACKFLSEKKQKSPAMFPCVIATGGGICSNKEAISFLRSLNGLFIFLQVKEELAADRIIKESTFEENTETHEKHIANLPAYIAKKNPHTLQDVRNIFHEFYVERTGLYNSLADFSVTLDSSSIEENTSLISEIISKTE